MTQHWANNDAHPVEDWKAEVVNDETRLGYRDWVRSRTSAFKPKMDMWIRHLKRDSRYEIVGFTKDIPPWCADGMEQVINHPKLGVERVLVQHSTSEEAKVWVLYKQIDGSMIFARPEHEFTADRFEVIT